MPDSNNSWDGFNSSVDQVMQRFNNLYMMVNENGKAVIYQPGIDPILKRRHFDRMSARDLRTLYMNEMVQTGVDEQKRPIYKSAADVWLRNVERLQFIGGVAFDPTMKVPAEVLNLWEGFAVDPAPGNWSLMQDHIRDVICDGDSDVRYKYLIRWIARMIQRPAEQGEVAVVMKGDEGTGKGTLAKALMHILGQHGLAISNAKHLIGNFNSHLRDAVFLFADEAFFAGDRQHIGVLKSLITEPYLTIEAKYANAVQSPNFLHIMMASNDDWVIPASLQSRRFFVLDVPSKKRRDHAYFAAIWKQMSAGGYAGMLHDLLAMDLTGFDVRDVPTTAGLHEQRKLSLPVPERWWEDVLHRGYVFRSKLGLEAEFGQWLLEISTELLFASYTDYADKARDRHPMSRETFGRFMVRMGGKPCRLSSPADKPSPAVGEHIVDHTDLYGKVSRKAEAIRLPSRPHGYRIGGIDVARRFFVKATGLACSWPVSE